MSDTTTVSPLHQRMIEDMAQPAHTARPHLTLVLDTSLTCDAAGQS